ncbi:unnamed protein product [Closterium sp. NIES-64]|nr:unnamed protein product [Closterium sp. NIES-64]CAI5996067.1 unnamed protein product [Closterium sp. NIES-64]
MVWDPWLIVAQIACLQSLFYLSLGVFLWLFVGSHVPRFTLKYFFDYSVISPSSFVGWCCIFAFLANAFVGAFYLVVVVERTKKCLDFAATVHLLHALLCLLYTRVPSSFSFWLTSFLSCLLMTLLGEWLERFRFPPPEVLEEQRDQVGPDERFRFPLLEVLEEQRDRVGPESLAIYLFR